MHVALSNQQEWKHFPKTLCEKFAYGHGSETRGDTSAVATECNNEERCRRPGLVHRTHGLFTIALSAANNLKNNLTEGRGRCVRRRHVRLAFSIIPL